MNATPSLRHSAARSFLALALVSTGFAAHAQSLCDNTVYMSQSDPSNPTQLQASPGTLPVNFEVKGASATRTYNALGYSPSNGKLYGTTANGNVLVEVDKASGATTDLGAITGVGGIDRFNSGAFSSSGEYYVKPFGNNAQLYRIDVSASPPAATLITLSQSFTTSDMAWYGGVMYSTADNGQLYAIDVSSGTTTAVGAPDATGGVLGAQFSGTNGLFGSANNGTGLYRIDVATGQREKISDSPSSSNNDGASCPSAVLFVQPADPASVPTLDFTGLSLLGLLGAGAGALALRRRQHTHK